MLPVVQSAVVEGVEDELAGHADQIDGAPAIFGEEAAGGGEVLPVQDLCRLVGPVGLGGMALDDAREGGVDVR